MRRVRPRQTVPVIVICPTCRLQRQIWLRPGPSSKKPRECQSCANLRWQDEIDDRKVTDMINGLAVDDTTRAERQAAVRMLTDQRWNAAKIAKHLDISERTVTRLRTREGKSS